MYMDKRRGVQSVRDKLKDDIHRKNEQTQIEDQGKIIQRESIRQIVKKSRMSVEKYRQSKIQMTKDEYKQKTEQEKRLIYKYEKEAQELEAAEAALMVRL